MVVRLVVSSVGIAFSAVGLSAKPLWNKAFGERSHERHGSVAHWSPGGPEEPRDRAEEAPGQAIRAEDVIGAARAAKVLYFECCVRSASKPVWKMSF